VTDVETGGHIPLPHITEWNRPFFEGGLTGKLRLQQCDDCQELMYYPRIACPNCLSMEHHWVDLSGDGTVYSYSIVWRPQHPAFLPMVPIILAAIQLAEGILIVSNIVNSAPEAVRIDMPVRVVFDRVSEQIALPKFEPAEL